MCINYYHGVVVLELYIEMGLKAAMGTRHPFTRWGFTPMGKGMVNIFTRWDVNGKNLYLAGRVGTDLGMQNLNDPPTLRTNNIAI
jgi:hypothetical protein